MRIHKVLLRYDVRQMMVLKPVFLIVNEAKMVNIIHIQNILLLLQCWNSDRAYAANFHLKPEQQRGRQRPKQF